MSVTGHLRRLLPLAGITILLALPCHVSALGLGVSPGALEFETRWGQSRTETLHVFNQSDSTSTFSAYVDEEYAQWVSLTPDEFVLAPGESRDVDVAVSPPLGHDREYNFLLYVVSFTQGSNPNLGAGIKVPVHVTCNSWMSPIPAYGFVIIALALSLAALLIWFLRHKRASNPTDVQHTE